MCCYQQVSESTVLQNSGRKDLIEKNKRLHVALMLFLSKCPNRHLRPVWQVAWNKQESKFSGLEAEEVLVSMSGDGRISMWQRCNNHLECIGTVVCMNHPVVTNGVSDRHANILYTTEHR